MAKELINTAYSILEKYKDDETIGLISHADAKKMAASHIQNLRYGEENKDYFWITDMQPVMVVHPYRPELIEKDLSNFEDSHGKKLFVEAVKIVVQQKQGYIDYMWQWKDDSTRIVPKLSYVKLFEPWGWIIGTGIYIEDVKQEISVLSNRFTRISFIITILIVGILFYIGNQSYILEKRRKKTEEALNKAKEKYRSLIEFTAEGSALVIDGEIVFTNKQFRDLLGYQDQVGLPVSFVGLFIEEEPNRMIIDTLRGNKILPSSTFQFEGIVRSKGGLPIEVLVNVSRITIEGKEGYIINFRDLKRINQLKEELDQVNEKFQDLASSFDIGIFRLSAGRNGRFLDANEATMRILNFTSPKEVQNYRWADFIPDLSVRKQLMRELFTSGKVKSREVKIITKQRSFTVAVSLEASMDNDNKIKYFDGIIEDITLRKNKEQVIYDKFNALQSSRFLLEQNIGSLMQKPVTIGINTNIGEAVRLMKKHCRDEILVCNEKDELIGIITNSDLRNRILFTKALLTDPVFKYMTSPVVKISVDACLNEFICKAVENNVARLAIVDAEEKPAGVLSMNALPALQRLTPYWLHVELNKTQSVDEIHDQFNKLPEVVDNLLQIDSNVQNIIHTISEFSDSVNNKVLEIIFKELGEPPVSFSIIALGSQGRFEQTLATDQDNALIIENLNRQLSENELQYLRLFSVRYNDYLHKSGYKLCRGDVMVRNPMWRKSLDEWKESYLKWINNSTPKDLLEITIFFDLRPIYGANHLYGELTSYIQKLADNQVAFFFNLVKNALLFEKHSPFGLFGSSVEEQFDVKKLLTHTTNYARIKALKYGITETNTIRRLEALLNSDFITRQAYNDLCQMFETLYLIRLRHQVSQFKNNSLPDNIIPLKELNSDEISRIKEIISLTKDYMQSLTFEFKGTA